MSQFRYAIARLFAGLLCLGLCALLLNSLVLTQNMRLQAAALLAGPEPVATPLGTLQGDPPPPEVRVLARIDGAIDVAVPGGAGRVYLLTDPQAATGSAARIAAYVAPRDLDAFEEWVASATRGEAGGAPVIDLWGKTAVPVWIDRIEAAVAESGRSLSGATLYVEPFLHGRAAGLAPPPLAYAVPAVLFLLLAALLGSEIRSIAARRAMHSAQEGLSLLDREVEETAALAASLQAGDRQWTEIANRRHELRRKRAWLDARLRRGEELRAGGWIWVLMLSVLAVASLMPRRPLLDALSAHLAGVDLAGLADVAVLPTWAAPLGHLADLPGETVARLVTGIFGPQSVGVAGAIRTLPAAVWLVFLVVIGLHILRRVDAYRSHQRNND